MATLQGSQLPGAFGEINGRWPAHLLQIRSDQTKRIITKVWVFWILPRDRAASGVLYGMISLNLSETYETDRFRPLSLMGKLMHRDKGKHREWAGGSESTPGQSEPALRDTSGWNPEYEGLRWEQVSMRKPGRFPSRRWDGAKVRPSSGDCGSWSMVWMAAGWQTTLTRKEAIQEPEQTPSVFIVWLKTMVLPLFSSLWDSDNTAPGSLDSDPGCGS